MTERAKAAAPNVTSIDERKKTEPPTPDFSRVTNVMLEGWTAMSNHVMTLAQQSIQANLDAAEEMRRCQSPRDLADVQMRYAKKVYENYLDEAREMGALMARMSSDTIGAITPFGKT